MILASVLSPIEDVLTEVLIWFHETAGIPWAWAIVALTVLVRILLVPLAVKQVHSMQSLQMHAPEMKAIQNRYKHDRQRQSEELMKFYRENKINPYASCLPILFQIPIFFALFFVLRDFEDEVFSVYGGELHWLGFVPDITAGITEHWSGYLLLVVYLGSQLTSTWLMSTAMQSTAQRVVIMALPLVFIPFILDPPGSTVFPVGLLIYWLTTNLWTTGQGIVTRRLMPRPVGPPPKRSSRTPPRGASAEPALAAEAGGGSSADATPSRSGPPRRVKRKKGGRKR